MKYLSQFLDLRVPRISLLKFRSAKFRENLILRCGFHEMLDAFAIFDYLIIWK